MLFATERMRMWCFVWGAYSSACKFKCRINKKRNIWWFRDKLFLFLIAIIFDSFTFGKRFETGSYWKFDIEIVAQRWCLFSKNTHDMSLIYMRCCRSFFQSRSGPLLYGPIFPPTFPTQIPWNSSINIRLSVRQTTWFQQNSYFRWGLNKTFLQWSASLELFNRISRELPGKQVSADCRFLKVRLEIRLSCDGSSRGTYKEASPSKTITLIVLSARIFSWNYFSHKTLALTILPSNVNHLFASLPHWTSSKHNLRN